MDAITLKLQCLSLANGDVVAAQAIFGWIMEPLPLVDKVKLVAAGAPALQDAASATQPEIQPSGTARR